MALLVRSMSNALMPLHAIFSGKWHLTLVTTELCYSVVHSFLWEKSIWQCGHLYLDVLGPACCVCDCEWEVAARWWELPCGTDEEGGCAAGRGGFGDAWCACDGGCWICGVLFLCEVSGGISAWWCWPLWWTLCRRRNFSNSVFGTLGCIVSDDRWWQEEGW